MIFEGYPGGAQAETTRSGGGERTVGGRTSQYGWRLQDTGYNLQNTSI